MTLLCVLLSVLLMCGAGVLGFVPAEQPRRVPLTVRSLSSSSDDDDDSFMKSLQNRIAKSNQIPLVFRDTLLPRQVLQMTVKRGVVLDLVKSRLQEESPYFGMVGIQQQNEGGRYLARGVQVEIIGYEMNQWKTGLRLTLKAGKRFVIKDLVDNDNESWREGRVEFLDSGEQEAEERDLKSKALAMEQAKQFSDPDSSTNESKSLVDMWLDLARTKEQYEGQIDQLLSELGEMPDWKEPSECAFWVGALINPTPAIGLAVDIRQKLVLADTAQERTQIALDAIRNSIERMDPSPALRGWDEDRSSR